MALLYAFSIESNGRNRAMSVKLVGQPACSSVSQITFWFANPRISLKGSIAEEDILKGEFSALLIEEESANLWR